MQAQAWEWSGEEKAVGSVVTVRTSISAAFRKLNGQKLQASSFVQKAQQHKAKHPTTYKATTTPYRLTPHTHVPTGPGQLTCARVQPRI
jgi:hypothetical protein